MSLKTNRLLSLLLLLSACPSEDPVGTAETDAPDPTTEGETDITGSEGTSGPDSNSGPSEETGDTDAPVPGTTTSGGEAFLSFEEYVQAYNEITCERSVACGQLPNTDVCGVVENDFHDTRVAMEAGELSFDGAAAENCISTWMGLDQSCPSLLAEPTPQQELDEAARASACEPVFTGLARIGGECHAFDACSTASGPAFCQDLNSFGCIPGTCTAAPTPQPQGGDCDIHHYASDPCESGLYCRPTEPGNFESDGTCEPVVAVGEDCYGDDGCVPGSFCVEAEQLTDPGTCELVGTPGGSCIPRLINASTSCDSTTDYCDLMDETCQPRREVGETCDDSSECVGYAFCPNGTCTASGDEGDPCEPGSLQSCLGFLHCDADTSTCSRFEPPICE